MGRPVVGQESRRQARIVHGLTHRRLDDLLALPQGSTSNVFPRRADLLRAAVDALVSHEMSVVADLLDTQEATPWTVNTAAAIYTALMDRWLLPANRPLLVARYTLMLEAPKMPELTPLLETARARFITLAELLYAGTDVPHHYPGVPLQLVAWADGILLAYVTAGDKRPARTDMERGVRRLLVD